MLELITNQRHCCQSIEFSHEAHTAVYITAATDVRGEQFGSRFAAPELTRQRAALLLRRSSTAVVPFFSWTFLDAALLLLLLFADTLLAKQHSSL